MEGFGDIGIDYFIVNDEEDHISEEQNHFRTPSIHPLSLLINDMVLE